MAIGHNDSDVILEKKSQESLKIFLGCSISRMSVKCIDSIRPQISFGKAEIIFHCWNTLLDLQQIHIYRLRLDFIIEKRLLI